MAPKVVIIIVTIVVLVIIAYIIKKHVNNENYSYSFGFPTWGSNNYQYSPFNAYGNVGPYFYGRPEDNLQPQYSGITPQIVNELSQPLQQNVRPQYINSRLIQPLQCSQPRPYSSPYNRYIQPINYGRIDNYETGFTPFFDDSGFYNPFMARDPNSPFYWSSIAPYMSNSCYSSSENDGCVPGYYKIKNKKNHKHHNDSTISHNNRENGWKCCRF